jgi:hypothetical protein
MEENRKRKLKSQMFFTDLNGEYIAIQHINTDSKAPSRYWKEFDILGGHKAVHIYQDQIYEIQEFLTYDEQKYFLDLIDTCNEECWPQNIDNEFQENDPGISGTVLPLQGRLVDLTRVLDSKVASLFKNSTRINNIAAIQRYKPNTNMGIHKDDELDSTVQYGVVIYLNDNYEGGEIYYPELNITIKPKARSIIIHPAGLAHGVTTIKGNNTRYILSSFVRGEEKVEVYYGK